mmetsp:Transcript_251/g.225  ORF Transcript_251/g.225 Transcript_251/m.225 type:complete len:205 (+) Transcript_251:1152-1766(+)
MLSDFMVDMEIDSLGEEHIDFGIKSVSSTVEFIFLHVFRDGSHSILANFIDNLFSNKTILGIISKEFHLIKHAFGMGQVISINHGTIISIVFQSIVLLGVIRLSIWVRVEIFPCNIRISSQLFENVMSPHKRSKLFNLIFKHPDSMEHISIFINIMAANLHDLSLSLILNLGALLGSLLTTFLATFLAAFLATLLARLLLLAII